MIKYHSDDAFDNMYIDSNLKRLWKEEGYEKLTPIRNWERKEKYQMTSTFKCLKLSRKEIQLVIRKLFPSIMFVIFGSCIITADFVLYKFLNVVQEKGEFGISFNGMESGLDLGSLLDDKKVAHLEIEAFNLTTDKCLPRPKKTDSLQLTWIILIMIFSIITCLFDVYFARWRSRICNGFNPKVARERGIYLHKKIKAGRGNRRFQLKLVATRQKKKQDRLLEMPSSKRLRKYISDCFAKCKTDVKVACHGCSTKCEKDEFQTRTFQDFEGTIEVILCNDCLKDE